MICGQGVAPDAATPERFASLGLDLVPGTGLLPAVVPGAFDAWMLVLRDWGTWEVNDVLSYAIAYAKAGIHIVPRISARWFSWAWARNVTAISPVSVSSVP